MVAKAADVRICASNFATIAESDVVAEMALLGCNSVGVRSGE